VTPRITGVISRLIYSFRLHYGDCVTNAISRIVYHCFGGIGFTFVALDDGRSTSPARCASISLSLDTGVLREIAAASTNIARAARGRRQNYCDTSRRAEMHAAAAFVVMSAALAPMPHFIGRTHDALSI
jgi:hypothetical protein